MTLILISFRWIDGYLVSIQSVSYGVGLFAPRTLLRHTAFDVRNFNFKLFINYFKYNTVVDWLFLIINVFVTIFSIRVCVRYESLEYASLTCLVFRLGTSPDILYRPFLWSNFWKNTMYLFFLSLTTWKLGQLLTFLSISCLLLPWTNYTVFLAYSEPWKRWSKSITTFLRNKPISSLRVLA